VATRGERRVPQGLDQRGIPAARGGKWSAVQVTRLLAAAASLLAEAYPAAQASARRRKTQANVELFASSCLSTGAVKVPNARPGDPCPVAPKTPTHTQIWRCPLSFGNRFAAHCARAAASDARGWISQHRKVLAERGPTTLRATPHRRDLYHNGERTQSVPPLSAASRAARAIAIFGDADHTMSRDPVTTITVPALVF
jgi:hypothetical protein